MLDSGLRGAWFEPRVLLIFFFLFYAIINIIEPDQIAPVRAVLSESFLHFRVISVSFLPKFMINVTTLTLISLIILIWMEMSLVLLLMVFIFHN